MKFRHTYTGQTDTSVSAAEIQHRAIARKAAAEGIVLLENNGILPLQPSASVALYGGGARYTIKGGTGSGSVNSRDTVSVDQGLRGAGIRVTTDQWLDAYDGYYSEAKKAWKQMIYDMSEPGDFNSLYRAHAANPMAMPMGDLVTAQNKTDTDTAIYVICRTSGEGADRKAVKGDYYLSDEETAMLRSITEHYRNTIVVLNIGGIIDLSFMDEMPVAALVLLTQAGAESGNALADVLTGKVCPSGRLTDTWAYRYEDYPSSENFSHNNGNIIEEKYTDGIYVGYRYFDTFRVKPRYPFGYGLSYTSFTQEIMETKIQDDCVSVHVCVTNEGECAGRQTVLLFAACPDGLRVKEAKRLTAFGKTDLLAPGEEQTLILSFDLEELLSWHTGKSRYYLEAGSYYVLAGTTALDWQTAAILQLRDIVWMKKRDAVCPLLDALSEIAPSMQAKDEWQQELLQKTPEGTPVLSMDDEAAAMQAQETADMSSGKSGTERYIFAKTDTLERAKEILSGLSLEEKARLCCGRHKDSNAGFIGTAAAHVPGAAGETISFLQERFGLDPAVLADGPAGIRVTQKYEINPEDGTPYLMEPYQNLENRIFGTVFPHPGAPERYQFCTAIPIGMLLAQSFDTQLLQEVGRMISEEMEEMDVTLWLAPGMNIHRNPLCGRNFEYYSEDPLLSGFMAAAITEGVQSRKGFGTTIKHYACNNQEENRRGVSSIVSERALREIYLKGFEIAVRKSQPLSIMTSYNRVNQVHTANSYDLCTIMARKEWGFAGIIMTDWTTTNTDGGSSAAKCIHAGNDLVMPGKPNDVREIIDAVLENGDQSLAMEDLDACCLRMLIMLIETQTED